MCLSPDMAPTLVSPSARYKAGYLEALAEFHGEGRNTQWRVEELRKNFDLLLRRLDNTARGIDLPPGDVAATQLWLVDGDDYIGRVNIRHTLTEELRKEGGHIGYEIRPGRRRRGYGMLALTLALGEARRMGLASVLITCDDDNIASRTIIERHGGVPVDSDDGYPSVLRFWIHPGRTDD